MVTEQEGTLLVRKFTDSKLSGRKRSIFFRIGIVR
mgnify:CR=1 FL=1|jgi:hypothetical protein